MNEAIAIAKNYSTKKYTVGSVDVIEILKGSKTIASLAKFGEKTVRSYEGKLVFKGETDEPKTPHKTTRYGDKPADMDKIVRNFILSKIGHDILDLMED